MNELVVPSAPHWYKSSVVTCSPDNTLIYGSKNDIVIIKEKTPEEPVQVQTIHGAHSKHIISVSLNKKWKDPHSYVASLGEDNVIKVWNLDTLEKKTTNKDHTGHKEPVIGAVFAGEDRVVSAASHGHIIVWNINTNESKPLNDLFKNKVTLTCLSSCPHAAWLLAFGLSTGCVVIADVRRNGQLLYRLRGHYQSVVSLSWCPAPVNVFPRYVNNKVKNKSQNLNISASPEAECSTDKSLELDVEKIKNGEKESDLDEPIKVKENRVNPWVNLKHADDDEVPVDKEVPRYTATTDFLEECAALKERILGAEIAKKLEGLGEATESQSEETKENLEETNGKNEVEELRFQEIVQGRPLPKLFGPSGDFLDDSGFDDNAAEIKNRLLDTEIENKKVEKISGNEEDTSEDKDSGNEKNVDGRSELEDKDASEEKAILEDKDVGNEKTKLEEQIEEEPRTEFLLASSGKDKSVYIWRAGTDGRMQTYFYASRKGNRRDKNPNSWISLCWVTPDTILTSSTTGEILAWSLPKPKDSNKQFKLVHSEHSSFVFNIVAPPQYMTAYNWRDKVDVNIWTWGQEGKLVNFDLATEKVRYSYATVSAMVTCFASSSLDPHRLAIGLRDGGIRLWDLSLPNINVVTMQKHQQKITHRVSAIAWHPQKEMVLGFGTEEGRVGFMDLASKKSSLFPYYSQGHVYKVEWGPIRGSLDNLGLYVLADGKMVFYDMQRPDEDPVHLELPAKCHVYNFAWKPNYSFLLLNGKDGSLEVLNRDLSASGSVYVSDKGLNGIVWHPDAFTDKNEISSRCNWFATTTSKGVKVFDCTSIGETDNFADNVVANFEGHVRPPLALAWCPFEGNRIVSSAADGLSHVWDITTKAVIATFVDSYLSHNLAIAWSPVEPDLIIMGDKTLRVWSISKNPPKVDDEFMAARKRLLTKFGKTESDKADKNKIKVSLAVKPKSHSKNYIVPALYVSNDENITSQIENMRKLLDGEGSQSDDKLLDPLKIFGGRDQVTQLLDANYGQQSKEGKYKSCEMISLWKGSVGDYIENAIIENRVTPSVIALAPMVSPKLWQSACLTYAKKLTEEANSDPLEAAMYFLVCHKIEEAINCLCLNSMFKEALALAKHRLPEGSDIITKVAEQWADHCKNTGNFENAAYCYISIRDYENAAKVLARRNHKEVLEFALELAEKAGNKGLCDSIKFKCTELENKGETNGIVEEDIPSRSDAVVKIVQSEENSETSSTVDESQIEIPVEEVSTLDNTGEKNDTNNEEQEEKI